MYSVILVIHLIVTVSLVGIILLQRSEGGGLGVGGSGNMGAMAPRAQADVLTKTTGVLATLFIMSSISLVILGAHSGENSSLVNQLAAPTPSTEAPAVPAAPAEPSVPLSK